MARETALNALELGLRRAVALVDAAAGGTGAAGVSGIDGDERQPRVRGLVGQEGAQLVERPGRENRTLLLGSRDPGANIGQVFDGDPAPGAFGSGDDLLGDAMVDVY